MLRLVLPKGSLERATMALFEDADLTVQRDSDVDYRGEIDDPRVIDVTVLRPQEIPRYVASGLFDVGITGRDWIEETSAEVVTLTELHYSKATARPIRMVSRSRGTPPVDKVEDLPRRRARAHRVPGADPPVLRQGGRRRGDHALVRRDRGEDPGDRRRGGRDHRDRARAAGRGPEGARHDPRLVHGADREPAGVRRTRRSARRWSRSGPCSPVRSKRVGECS